MKAKYDSIQVMRGIAALSVVMMHVGMIANGAFGVDLFFCISGFIMMHVTEKSGHQFLEKRVIRVFPLYCLTTIILSVALIIKPDLFRTTVLTLEFFIKSMLLIPYYYTGKSGQTISAINTVGWTLILEAFFYFLFFVAMKINHIHRHYIASGFFVLLTIIDLTIKSNNTFVRFYCSPVMLKFSLGMFAYKFLHRPDTKKWGFFVTIIAIIAATLIWSGLFAMKNITEHVVARRLVVYGLPSLVFFILVFKALEGRLMPRPLMILGNISYSLYLTHPFVVLGFSRLVYNVDNYSPMGVILVIVVVIPITIIVAWFSWWLIENKLTEWMKRQVGILG